MKDTLTTTLLARELTSSGFRSKFHPKLYSDRSLLADLDIIHELPGHSGCVNALSWSKSGNFLASGSDDQHLNIHTYQPADSTEAFKLTTTVATGHTQNIFSVKFMPHRNDRTVVTAAGDGEVRVFDLEYAGQAREASAASSLASEGRRRRRAGVYSGVRYLGDGDTDCRVYRSHGDRVKRIVTESSPHLFLTCSEDGEVRQWDLRQPSSAYPPPRTSRFSSTADGPVPPPLISYKRYNLDLNTISCSPSQPHYIALGGAHLHCFLHDRRMTGRDRLQEAGKPLSPASSMSAEDEEYMSQATQCVRKFAPKGQQKMKRTESGHITACKISDARPDEMVVSWSGDHIYSFDLVRSPDASEEGDKVAQMRSGDGRRAKESRERKRKRKANASETSLGQQESAARGSSRPRRGQAEGAALRVRYQNGQSEDIPIQPDEQAIQPLTETHLGAQRLAKTTVKIRSSLFTSSHQEESRDPTAPFSEALGHAASILPDIDATMRSWRYPLDPSADRVIREQTLRSDRESTRRFVQAAGTLARVLGGALHTASSGPSPLLGHFQAVEARSNDLEAPRQEHFGYDFLKAITLWLESGVGRLIEGFARPAAMLPHVKAAQRLPIPDQEACVESIEEILIPYLYRLASDKPVVNVEANRFEVEERRRVFPSEKAAVLAFAAAVRIPFADLSSAVVVGDGGGEGGSGSGIQAQDRQTALKFWGRKVARGVLLNAAEGVNFVFVNRAFGGLGRVVRGIEALEEGMEEVGGGGGEEEGIREVEMVDAEGNMVDGANAEDIAAVVREARERGGGVDEEMAEGGRSSRATAEADDDDDDDDDEPALVEDDDDDDEADDDDDDHDDTDNEEDEESPLPATIPGLPAFLYRDPASSFQHRLRKESVAPSTPCSPPTRSYQGHLNLRTVKDVNFLGPDDSYVVSGSDDANFFIWDRKTAELVNVLEGDGEVVNVVQGHPYEGGVVAVSGIDSTIKIFSPDSRARAQARLGLGDRAREGSGGPSLHQWPHRLGRRGPPRRPETMRRSAGTTATGGGSDITSEPAMPPSSSATQARRQQQQEEEDEDDDFVAPGGLASRRRMHDAYRITSRNDQERQGGGGGENYITVPHHQLLQLLFGNMGNIGVFPSFGRTPRVPRWMEMLGAVVTDSGVESA